MKRLLILALFAILSLSLTGCGKGWTNYNIADPREEDKLYDRDNSYCEKWANQRDYVGSDQEQIARDDMLGAETFDESVNEYHQFQDNQAAYEHCMKARGWEKVK